MHRSVALALLVIAFLAASSAFAKSSDELYVTGDEKAPVLIHNSSGIIFLGSSLDVYRTYAWKQAKQNEFGYSLYVVDLDKDGKKEIIGVGHPTFALYADSDPMWADKAGCDQVLIGDFAADEKLDLACVLGTRVRILTYDHQMVWELNLGKRIKGCRAEDLNGDSKLDLECVSPGKKPYSRLDGNTGAVIAIDSDEGKISGEVTRLNSPVEAVAADAIPEELKARKPKGTPVALVQQDLNKDSYQDSVLLTDKQIVVENGAADGAKTIAIHDANAKKYKRAPIAILQSVYVNGFEDNKATEQLARDLQPKLAKCYAKAVAKDAFSGSGRLIITTTVDDAGKVKDVQRIHSSLSGNQTSTCVTSLLKKSALGKSAEGATGELNLTILYSFVSK